MPPTRKDPGRTIVELSDLFVTFPRLLQSRGSRLRTAATAAIPVGRQVFHRQVAAPPANLFYGNRSAGSVPGGLAPWPAKINHSPFNSLSLRRIASASTSADWKPANLRSSTKNVGVPVTPRAWPDVTSS